MAKSDQHPTQTITTILTLAVTIAAGVAVYEPLTSLRQEIVPPDKVGLLYKNEVRARLWEDPLVAVEEHSKQESTGTYQVYINSDNSGKPSVQVRPSPTPSHHHDIKFVGNETGETVSRGNVSILIAMTSGRPYAEDVEFRIRQRYAILAGLDVAEKYHPQANQVLHYFELTWPITKKKGSQKPSVSTSSADFEKLPLKVKVPYEWLESKELKKWVLVVWLREDALERVPLERLADLTTSLQNVLAANSREYPHVRVLGPASSETLAAMYTELDCASLLGENALKINDRLETIDKFLRGVTIYSYAAGVAPEIPANLVGANLTDLPPAIRPLPRFVNLTGAWT